MILHWAILSTTLLCGLACTAQQPPKAPSSSRVAPLAAVGSVATPAPVSVSPPRAQPQVTARTRHKVDSEIYFAACAGKLQEVRQQLNEGGSPDSNLRSFTALMCAAQNDKLEVLALLLERGADVNRSNLHGDLAINFASTPSITSYLKQYGSLPDSHAFEQRVFAAIARQFPEIARVHPKQTLIELLRDTRNKAHAMDLEYEHEITLFLMARLVLGFDVANTAKIKNTLLNHRVPDRQRIPRFLAYLDKTRNRSKRRYFTETLRLSNKERLYSAAARNDLDELRALVQLGMDVNISRGHALRTAASKGHLESIKLLLQADAQVSQADSVGFTALHRAASHGRTSAAVLLIERGANVNAQSKIGLTPVDMADDYRLLRQILLDLGGRAGRKPEQIKPAKAHPHAAALLNACLLGDLTAAGNALDSGADLESRSTNQATALILAAQEGHTQIVELLLARGAKVNARAQLDTALHSAANRNYVEVMHQLIAAGANVNRPRGAIHIKDFSTPLMIAASQGHFEATHLLLQSGAKVNRRNVDGATAQHYAAREGHTEIVHLLKQHGASASITDEDGYTVDDFMRRSGHVSKQF